MNRTFRRLSVFVVLALGFLLAWTTMVTQASSRGEAGIALGETVNWVLGHARTDEDTPRPVQNARIVARRAGTGEVQETTTDAHGAYTLSLPVGTATWYVRAETTTATTPSNLVPPPQARVLVFGRQADVRSDVDFTFHALPEEERARIIGHVLITGTTPTVPTFPVTVTATSVPIPNVRVQSPIGAGTGVFELAVPPGRYQVNVMPEDPSAYIPPLLLPFTVEAGDVHDMGFLYLRPVAPGTATVQGQVLTPQDDPVSGVTVVAALLSEKGMTTASWTPVRRVVTDAQGRFTHRLSAGTWWIAVALGPEDPYMPYRFQWQKVLTVADEDVVKGVVLRVMPADVHIHGRLVRSDTGAPATDACGVVAAFRKGTPVAYAYRTFVGETFDLSVVPGEYRLTVIPNPDLSGLGVDPALYPPSCTPGAYMVTSKKGISATQDANVTITLPVAETTVHGHLWDVDRETRVLGVSGLLLGWHASSDRAGTWSATHIDPDTGTGNLRAGPGNWILAFQVDPNTPYVEMPPVQTLSVPPNTRDVDVNLPVAQVGIAVRGRVLAPDGKGVRGAVVLAMGLAIPDGSSAERSWVREHVVVTREDGAFVLGLPPGSYVLSVVGPPSLLLGEEAWISPQPELISVREDQPAPEPVLQFRSGDAVIHGHLALATPSGTSKQEDVSGLPALVWAATASAQTLTAGHTRTWVEMSSAGEGTYSLPLLQGQKWVVGALYEVENTLWITQTVVDVNRADIVLDLTLAHAYTVAQDLAQMVNPGQSFYGELEDGASLYIPAGVLQDVASLPGTPVLLTFQASIMDALAEMPVGMLPGMYDAWPQSAGGTSLLLVSPMYTVDAQDVLAGGGTGGTASLEEEEAAPMVLRIPYDADVLAVHHIPESALRVVHLTNAGTWVPVDGFVVDAANNQVVVFAQEMGAYAVTVSQARWSIFVPAIIQ